MADIQKIHSELSQLLQAKSEELRNSLSNELRQKLEAALQMAPGTSPTDYLNNAIESLQQFTAQTDILSALLDGAARFSGRSALFVVKGSALSGWQGRGWTHEEALKSTSVDANRGFAGRVVRDRTAAAAPAQDFDSTFVAQQGRPQDGNAWLLPLVVRDKVAAVLYCDSGQRPGTRCDSSALQILVRATGQWLEILTARKAAGITDLASPAVASSRPSSVSPVPVAQPAVSADPGLDHLPAEEKDLHVKARRFAKLLVDEIRLYNQAKVNEGRQSREIYRVLREDIEKSRETYNKRYANTSVANAGYFSQEVVRILADNDPSLLGSDFPG